MFLLLQGTFCLSPNWCWEENWFYLTCFAWFRNLNLPFSFFHYSFFAGIHVLRTHIQWISMSLLSPVCNITLIVPPILSHTSTRRVPITSIGKRLLSVKRSVRSCSKYLLYCYINDFPHSQGYHKGILDTILCFLDPYTNPIQYVTCPPFCPHPSGCRR